MAQKAVDLDAGSDANSGDDWANAYLTIQKGLTDALAGGQVFVRRTDSGTPGVDTAAASRTFTSPGTNANLTSIYAVKDGTTTFPPVDSDLMVKGVDTLVVWEASGAGNDIDFSGYATCHGIRFISADRFQQKSGEEVIWEFEDCELHFGGFLFWERDGTSLILKNTDLNPTSAGIPLLLRGGVVFEWTGGALTGTVQANFISINPVGFIGKITGVDLSNLGNNTLINITGADLIDFTVRNSEMPATYTFVTGTAPTNGFFEITRIASTSETALGSSDSVQDYQKETIPGTVELETTAVRTGGADDGADGAFSYKMTPNVNATLEGFAVSLRSPLLKGWVEGDGSTAKVFTVFVANSGGADYNKDDIRLVILTPDDGGTAQHDLSFSPHEKIAGGSTAVADDAVSAWGSGAANFQKLEVTLTPDFQGPAYGYVEFCKRFASSPESLFVDPKILVT